VSGLRQKYFFPEPQPLVDLLGRDFFKSLPEKPGVYFMRDHAENLLYIGKAKNLRKRLNSYRVANADRCSKRLLRLLSSVRKIECEECPDELAALNREAELLQLFKPKFNRAGTWPSKPRFVCWNVTKESIQTKISLISEFGWENEGPFKPSIIGLYRAIFGLIFISLHPAHRFDMLPIGWLQCKFPDMTQIPKSSYSGCLEKIMRNVKQAFSGDPSAFIEWARDQTATIESSFDRTVLEEDLMYIQKTCSTLSSKRLHLFN
jgi:predicted GIY-YIG superfamily endonuclease